MLRIGIYGLGLMGSSLALALKENYQEIMIAGTDNNNQHFQYCKKNKLIDLELSEDNYHQMEVIFLAIPVKAMIPVIDQLGKQLNNTETILSDMGSTKGEIANYMAFKYPELNYVGGHPMTGKETSGPWEAAADIFRDKYYILDNRADESHRQKVTTIINKIGSRVINLDPEKHDQIVALSSHLPQLMASGLSNLIASQREQTPIVDQLIGQGFLDMTRIAASDPRMWSDIFLSNKENMLLVIEQMVVELNRYKNLIKEDNQQGIIDFMQHGNETRQGLKRVNRCDDN